MIVGTEDKNDQHTTEPNKLLLEYYHLLHRRSLVWRDWNRRFGGSGWIFTDSTGTELNHGQSAERFVASPMVAEALSIRSALNQALEFGITNLQLKSDAQDLIRAITSQEKIKENYGLLFDIKALASMFTSIYFSFIPRTENCGRLNCKERKEPFLCFNLCFGIAILVIALIWIESCSKKRTNDHKTPSPQLLP